MGNRGVLHDAQREIVRDSAGQALDRLSARVRGPAPRGHAAQSVDGAVLPRRGRRLGGRASTVRRVPPRRLPCAFESAWQLVHGDGPWPVDAIDCVLAPRAARWLRGASGPTRPSCADLPDGDIRGARRARLAGPRRRAARVVARSLPRADRSRVHRLGDGADAAVTGRCWRRYMPGSPTASASALVLTKRPPWIGRPVECGGGAGESNFPVQSRSTRDVLQAYSVIGISRFRSPPTGAVLRQPSCLLRYLLGIGCAAS